MKEAFEIKVDARDFVRMANTFAAAGKNIKPALMRAVNHTGDKARTQVARALVAQTGLKYGKVREALATHTASPAHIVYRIVAKGAYTSLKEYAARQTGRGTSAAPWGKRRVFPHTFIVATLGGHVFERRTSARFPIRKLWGPAIPNEMVKDKSRAAFEGTVAAELPARLTHEIGAILARRAPA